MASIHFFTKSFTFSLPNPKKTVIWLERICVSENHDLEALTYVFCTDRYLLSLNKQYLNHADYTDILSFDYSENGKVNGEVFISISRVRENSRKYKQPFEVELRRVIAHGLLHLLGYDDKSPRKRLQMRRKEEACLSLWK